MPSTQFVVSQARQILSYKRAELNYHFVGNIFLHSYQDLHVRQVVFTTESGAISKQIGMIYYTRIMNELSFTDEAVFFKLTVMRDA